MGIFNIYNMVNLIPVIIGILYNEFYVGRMTFKAEYANIR